MDRYAILVDAGYFFAAGAQALLSRQVPRRHISLISPDVAIGALCERAALQTSISALLRIYWYDAILGPRPSLEQSTIAHLTGVKLRLGSLNNAGEQKGVDSLIVTDLIELARNRAISDAVLVSGDEDLRVAVQVAQTFGVRVHILAVGSAANNVSPALRMEADSVDALNAEWLEGHLRIEDPLKAPAVPEKPGTNASPEPMPLASNKLKFEEAANEVSRALLSLLQPERIAALRTHFATNKTVPPEFDGKLIAKTAAALGRQLSQDEKRQARGVFVTLVRDHGAVDKD